jgi:hypothetical protein
VLEAKQNCERDTAGQESGLSTCQNNRENENAVHEAIVLEVDVINDEQTWRKED